MGTLSVRGNRWVVPMTVVCLVLGGMLGIQVHSQQLRGASQVGRQTSAVVDMLTRSAAQVEQQQEEIERLRGLVAEYEKEAAGEKGVARIMQEELHTSRIALGTVAVKGPGVEMELSDSTMRAGGEFGAQDLYVIHDFDLLQIANEMWSAGAEAVSINGQRLLTGSAIACSARLIAINNITIASPYVFKAIGDKDKLMSALNIRDGVLDRLRVLQFPVKLTPKDEVVIPPISVAPKYEHARPLEKEAGR